MRTVLGVFSLLWKLYIAIIFFSTALILYPLIFPFLLSDKGKKRSFGIFIFWSWIFRLLCFYFVKKVRSGPLPDGPYLILANHMSYLDIFLMYSVMPKHPFLFLGKSEILKYPLIGTYFRRLNIPVYRGSRIKAAKSLIQAAGEVKKGWSIVIFPEGGIPDKNPRMVAFKKGAFQLAKTLEIPIVPMTFVNNHILFSDPTFILGPARPGISRVHIHPYIPVEEIRKMDTTELNKHCYKIIQQPLKDRYPDIC